MRNSLDLLRATDSWHFQESQSLTRAHVAQLRPKKSWKVIIQPLPCCIRATHYLRSLNALTVLSQHYELDIAAMSIWKLVGHWPKRASSSDGVGKQQEQS